MRRYGFRSYPATVLIDRGGAMRFSHGGFRSSDETILDRHIRALIDGSARGSK